MRYKALALDLDGTTLIGEDLPEANKLALQKAAASGYEIIVATARWIQMAQRVADQIGTPSVAIACSGAQVHDPRVVKDIFDERLPAVFVEELFEVCNNARCIATVTVSERVLLKLDGEPDRSKMDDEMTWVPQLSLDANDLPRIAAIQGSAVCEYIKRELKPKYADSVNIFDSIGPSGKLVLTLTNKRANKGVALQAACDHLNLDPKDVIAFGDAENDLAMFDLAGASVAMGQANDEVKSAADYVSAPNFECGVAQAIEIILEHGQLPAA
jgi:5-amino-6-(5-phospho-D-ribitylamino)uracil phosphatase